MASRCLGFLIILLVSLWGGPVAAQGGGPGITVYHFEGTTQRSCAVLDGTAPLATLSLGECVTFIDSNNTAGAGTGYDNFRFCADSEVYQDGYLDLKLEWDVSLSTVTENFSRIQFWWPPNNEYDSGGSSGNKSYTNGMTAWYAIPQNDNTRFFTTRAYLGAGSHTSADVEFTVCLMGVNAQEYEPPPPPLETYCNHNALDVFEVLSITEAIELSTGGVWSETLETTFDQLYAHFFFAPDVPAAVSYDVDLELNDAERSVTVTTAQQVFFGDAFRFEVPVTGGVTGTLASMLAQNNSADNLNLVGVCLYENLGSDFCPDGIELVNDGPVTLAALNGFWEGGAEALNSDFYTARLTVGNPNGLFPQPPADRHVAKMQITFPLPPEYNYTPRPHFIEAAIPAGEIITFTVPAAPAVLSHDSTAPFATEVENLAWGMILYSVCIIDAEDYFYNQVLTSEDCLLNNPDFAYPPTEDDWSTSGDVSMSTTSDHMLEFGSLGFIEQLNLGDKRAVYTMQIRARGDLEFGTERTSIVGGGPQTEVISAATMGIFDNMVYLTAEDKVFVEASLSELDYVCLLEGAQSPIGGILDSFDCVDPGENVSDTTIGTLVWVAQKLVYWVCTMIKLLGTILDAIYVEVRKILVSIPALPGMGGEFTWGEWIAQVIAGIADVVVVNASIFWGWISGALNAFVQWLGRTLYNIALWAIDGLGFDAGALLATLNAIRLEFGAFVSAMVAEARREFAAAVLLLIMALDVLLVLGNGVRAGVTGNTVAFTTAEIAAISPYISGGFTFVNDVASTTPIIGLNIIGLGIVAYGLAMWTGKKFKAIGNTMGIA